MSRLAVFCLVAVSCAGAAPQFGRGDLRNVASNVKLQELSHENVHNAISNPATMRILINCFLDSASCTNPTGKYLIAQVKNLGNGKGCEGCTHEEKKKRNELIYLFLSQFQENYPSDYRKVIDQIGVILARLRKTG